MEPWRKNLKALIDREGVDAFVDKLGVTEPAISRWRNGKRWPDPGMVIRICKAFGLTLDQLYGQAASASIGKSQPQRLDTPSRAEVVAIAERLQEARVLVEPYLTDDDRKSLEASAAKLARRAPKSTKGRTRAGRRGGAKA